MASRQTIDKGKKKSFLEILLTVLENIPIVLTVIFGAYAALITQIGTISQINVLFWVLTIVTSLATSELLVRFRKIYKIEDQTDQTLSILQQHINNNKILFNRTEIIAFHDRIESANEIWLCGLTLSSILHLKYTALIKDKLKQGASINVIILNPDSEALSTIVGRLEHKTTPQNLAHEIERSLHILCDLSQSYLQSKLEVRLFDTDMPYSIIATDPENINGHIHIEIYGHKCPTMERLHLEVDKKIDEKRFKTFYDEFKRRWDSSSPFIPFTSHRFTIDEPEDLLSRPVVFLDQNTIINHSVSNANYITPSEGVDFKLKSVEAIKSLLEQDYYVVVVNSHAGINREMVSLEKLDKIHRRLIDETRVQNKRIQAVYACPHKSETKCICRGSNLYLFRRACAELKIDLRDSYLVVTSASDITVGTHVGCKTIQVKGIMPVLLRTTPKRTVADLSEAVDKILVADGRKTQSQQIPVEIYS